MAIPGSISDGCEGPSDGTPKIPAWALPAVPFPELDESGVPRQKMPDCPACGEDELGVIHERLVLCYRCGWRLER